MYRPDVMRRGRMEEMLVVGFPRRRRRLVAQARGGPGEPVVLVDGGQLAGDVVVEAVEHDEEDADAGGVADEPPVGKGIRLHHAVFEGADRVDGFLGAAVEGRQVEVGRVVLVAVAHVDREQVCVSSAAGRQRLSLTDRG